MRRRPSQFTRRLRRMVVAIACQAFTLGFIAGLFCHH